MSYEEVADKFRENAAFAGIRKSNADEIVELVRTLEALLSIDRLTEKLLRLD